MDIGVIYYLVNGFSRIQNNVEILPYNLFLAFIPKLMVLLYVCVYITQHGAGKYKNHGYHAFELPNK